MAFVSVTNTCAVELRFLRFSQRCEITLGFKKPTAVTQTDMQNLSELVRQWWLNSGRAQMGPQTSFREVYVRDLTSESSGSWTNSTGIGTAGTLSDGSNMPGNVAIVLSFRTGLRGRANRGRNYWFGFGANQFVASNNPTLTSTYVGNLVTMYNRLLPGGANDPTPFQWVVISRQLNGVPQGRAIPIIAVIAVDNVVDSQRRRLPGRGL